MNTADTITQIAQLREIVTVLAQNHAALRADVARLSQMLETPHECEPGISDGSAASDLRSSESPTT